MATKNDELIIQLKKEIENKKVLLKHTKFNPLTNCLLELYGIKYNLHVCKREQLLFLIASIHSLQTSLKSLNPHESLVISGFTSEDWLIDLTCKLANLSLSLEKDRLKTLEERLHDLLSVDTKVEIEIEELKKQI